MSRRSLAEIRKDLSAASAMLTECGEKALVLKLCHEYAVQQGEDGLTDIEGKEGKIEVLYAFEGMGHISYEIAKHVIDVKYLLEDLALEIDMLLPAEKKGVPA